MEQSEIKLFEGQNIRYVWDEEKEQYFFSVVDVIQVLTESTNPQTYWRVLKKRLLAEGNETVTSCNALKLLAADGKMRLTDVATTEQLLLNELLNLPRTSTDGHRTTENLCRSVQSVGTYISHGWTQINTDTRNIYPWFRVVPCSSVVSTYPRKDASQREIIPTTDEHGLPRKLRGYF